MRAGTYTNDGRAAPRAPTAGLEAATGSASRPSRTATAKRRAARPRRAPRRRPATPGRVGAGDHPRRRPRSSIARGRDQAGAGAERRRAVRPRASSSANASPVGVGPGEDAARARARARARRAASSRADRRPQCRRGRAASRRRPVVPRSRRARRSTPSAVSRVGDDVARRLDVVGALEPRRAGACRRSPCTNGSGNDADDGGTVARDAASWRSHQTRSPRWSRASAARPSRGTRSPLTNSDRPVARRSTRSRPSAPSRRRTADPARRSSSPPARCRSPSSTVDAETVPGAPTPAVTAAPMCGDGRAASTALASGARRPEQQGHRSHRADASVALAMTVNLTRIYTRLGDGGRDAPRRHEPGAQDAPADRGLRGRRRAQRAASAWRSNTPGCPSATRAGCGGSRTTCSTSAPTSRCPRPTASASACASARSR